MDWATDAPSDYFVRVFEEWSKANNSKRAAAQVKKYIKDVAPDWAKYCR
jgi:hypothetical protein